MYIYIERERENELLYFTQHVIHVRVSGLWFLSVLAALVPVEGGDTCQQGFLYEVPCRRAALGPRGGNSSW